MYFGDDCYDDIYADGLGNDDRTHFDDDLLTNAVGRLTRTPLDGLSSAEVVALAVEAARLATLLADGAVAEPGCAFGSATYFVHLASFCRCGGYGPLRLTAR